MSIPSTIIKDDGSVDWNMFIKIKQRGGRPYENVLGQMVKANILSEEEEGNYPARGLEGLYFTEESHAKGYSKELMNRTPMLLTCRW